MQECWLRFELIICRTTVDGWVAIRRTAFFSLFSVFGVYTWATYKIKFAARVPRKQGWSLVLFDGERIEVFLLFVCKFYTLFFAKTNENWIELNCLFGTMHWFNHTWCVRTCCCILHFRNDKRIKDVIQCLPFRMHCSRFYRKWKMHRRKMLRRTCFKCEPVSYDWKISKMTRSRSRSNSISFNVHMQNICQCKFLCFLWHFYDKNLLFRPELATIFVAVQEQCLMQVAFPTNRLINRSTARVWDQCSTKSCCLYQLKLDILSEYNVIKDIVDIFISASNPHIPLTDD